jgi:hypothetical protein
MDVRHGIAVAVRVAVLLALGALLPAVAQAGYSPVNTQGATLSEPEPKLAAALSCSQGVDGSARAPVLLVHGTSLTPEENWSATYEPALSSQRIPCAVALPDRGTGDVQRNAEYVVHAIREVYRRAGRRIAIIGTSQGGMLPRWALRFWPDTRAMVDDLVGLAPDNHGTTQGRTPCRRECFPALWQQWDIAAFIAALNSFQETFAGISYTNVYTRYDEVVKPPTSAALHTGDGAVTNVSVQEICSLDGSDHITLGLANATGYALAMDALSNAGPASKERVGRRGCGQPGIPGYNPVRFAALVGSYFNNRDVGAAKVSHEPPLRCYVTGPCPGGSTALLRMRLTVRPRRVRAGKPVRLRMAARARIGGRLRGVRRALVRVAGRRGRTDSRGRLTLRVRFPHAGRRMVRARAPGYPPARVPVLVLRRRR